jgi:hypothetical protein
MDNMNGVGPEKSKTSGGRTRIDWDVRGILAILSLIGAFGLAAGQMLMGDGNEIPAWAAAVVSAVMGFYFGSRSSGDAK